MDVPLEISSHESEQACVICVRGEIDFATAPKLDEVVQQLIDNGATSLTFDFQDVTFMDSEGLKVLLRTQHRLKEHNGALRITHCSRTITRAFEVLGLSSRFDIER